MEELLHGLWRAFFNISQKYLLISGSSFLLFYILFKNRLKPVKIQKIFPGVKDYRREVSFSLLTMLIFAVVAYLTLRTFTYDYRITQVYADLNSHSKLYYAFSLVCMFFLHDFYFYWTHRLMHHKRFFRYFHVTHHLSTNPSPWSSYSFHPLEAFTSSLIIPIIAVIIPAHRSAIIGFLLFQLIYNVYGHLGFELYPKKFNKSRIGRWLNTGVAHNLHHKKFNGNYGLYTLIWDRLFKTVREDYDSEFEKVDSLREVRSQNSEVRIQK